MSCFSRRSSELDAWLEHGLSYVPEILPSNHADARSRSLRFSCCHQLRPAAGGFHEPCLTDVGKTKTCNTVARREIRTRTRQELLESSIFIHEHRSNSYCNICGIDRNLCTKTCDELKCEEDQIVQRKHRGNEATRETGVVSAHTSSIHLGRFGSASTVVKSGLDCDCLADEDEVIACEIEGAGVWDQHPTIVIKAACDYAHAI